METYYVPRKFVFDTPEDKNRLSREHSKESRTLKKSLEAEKQMPFVFNFPDPTNYKEAYSQLVKHILSVYNHIRLLVVEEYFDELKHVVRDVKIEQAVDCVSLMKELLRGCCEKLQGFEKVDRGENVGDSVNDYEELLQKAEAKIRVFIRNEQIFRLNFDILAQKCEDSDKVLQEVQKELESAKKSQEVLAKNNLSLTNKLKHKEDELKKLQKEFELSQKNLKDANANLSNIEYLDSTFNGDLNKSVTQSWNQQLLHMLLNEGKFTPTDVSNRMTEGKASWSRPKQRSSGGLPPTDKNKPERKSITPAHNTSLLNSSSQSLKKGKSDKLKSTLIADYKRKLATNRDILNASLDLVLNKSVTEHSYSQERPSHTSTSVNSQKRSSHGTKSGYSQDQMRLKPPSKDRKSENGDPMGVNKSAMMQKVMGSNKYSNASTRPTSTGKARGSPLVQRNRVAHTEQSPEPNERSQESRILYTYASNYGNEGYSGTYARKKYSETKDRENRENRSTSKGADKSSMMIKNMIAEQLSKKLHGKKGL
jgi:hypothetical protein